MIMMMSRTSLLLLGVLCLGPAAGAGSVAGKAVGWSSAQTLPSRHAVVWLEGGTDIPDTTPVPVMSQRGGQFVPDFLVVVSGQTVEMPNQDEVAHNVHSVSPTKTFNLGFYAKGEHKVVTFNRIGLVEVVCSIHTFMRARILVVPNTHYAILGADGTFRIQGVPAGSWTLKFWAEGMAPYRQEITVTANGTVQVDFHAASLTKGSRR